MAARINTQVPLAKDREQLESELRLLFAERPGDWFVSVVERPDAPQWHVRVEGPGAFHWTEVLEGPDQQEVRYVAAAVRQAITTQPPVIRRLLITGFGPFARTEFQMASLEVLVGANGSGKTSAFELLRTIRDVTRSGIPAAIVPGSESRQVFHRPGPDQLGWQLTLESGDVEYEFRTSVIGPIGNPVVAEERVRATTISSGVELARLTRRGETGLVFDIGVDTEIEIRNQRPNDLAFRSFVSPSHRTLHRLKEHVESWRFYSGIRLSEGHLRWPALTENEPILRDDGGNLASVVNWMRNEHPAVFNEFELHIRGIIPGFRALGVRPAGAGRVVLTWDEDGLVNPITSADLSDGSLRLLLWLTVALTPKVPALVCIDEPEVGLHPRTLPTIAGLLKKLSARTQVIVATHSSYLLAQFDVADIAVLRKNGGAIEFVKPGTSAVLLENLHDFGEEELELMHKNDELEALA